MRKENNKEVEQKKHIILYRDEFDCETWKSYCAIFDLDYEAEAIKVICDSAEVID